jgi:hypothetical protein
MFPLAISQQALGKLYNTCACTYRILRNEYGKESSAIIFVSISKLKKERKYI